MKKSRAPQVTLMGVTPALFGPINDLMNIRSGDCESRLAPVQLHAQGRETTAGRCDFVTTLDRGYLIRSRPSFVHRRFVMAKLKSRTQLQTRTLSAFQNAIDDVDGVLQMGQENAFLQNDVAHAIRPDRKAIVQTELVQPIRAFQIKLTAGAFFAAQRNNIVIAEAEKFRNVVPHDHATEWRGQCGDEQAMITTRDCARDRARSVTAESVCDEPLAREQDFARHFRTVPRHRANDRPDDMRLFIHGATPSRSNRRFFGCRRGPDSDTNRSAIADSAGNVQLSWVGSLTLPGPP